ncbi:hypothetical protein BV898_20158, partial [Hypsibius exemplaris]
GEYRSAPVFVVPRELLQLRRLRDARLLPPAKLQSPNAAHVL